MNDILLRICEAKQTYCSIRGKVEDPNYIELGQDEVKELEDFYNEISKGGSEKVKDVKINDGSVIMGMFIKKVEAETCLTIARVDDPQSGCWKTVILNPNYQARVEVEGK